MPSRNIGPSKNSKNCVRVLRKFRFTTKSIFLFLSPNQTFVQMNKYLLLHQANKVPKCLDKRKHIITITGVGLNIIFLVWVNFLASYIDSVDEYFKAINLV